jgi:peptidoglycan hydrolase-like protein with peptidoglycan-binding domain
MTAVIEATRQGRLVYDWVPIDVGSIRIWVMADAAQVDGVRVTVTATEAQQVADLIGAILPTPKIEDIIWQRSPVRIPPFPGEVTRRTAAQHSADIDRAIAGRTGMLVATVGKSWCLSNRLLPDRAMNYGWHGGSTGPSVSLPGVKVWQTPGLRHNPHHVDYSQTLRLVRRRCLVAGVEADLREVLTDPDLATRLSHEGVLRVLRQPGVTELGSAETLPAPPPDVAADSVRPLGPTRPTVRRGDKGQDVKLIQGLVGARVDGDFGPLTETAVKAWQGRNGLSADGVVGPKTWAVLLAEPVVLTSAPEPLVQPSRTPSGQTAALAGDEAGVPYVPAKHYRAGRAAPPIWITIHTAEVGEVKGAALALQRYAATMPDGRVASWHYAVDNMSITQSVRERDTAFHAKHANARSIGVELCQRANQTVAQWDDEYSRSVLALAASLCARIAQRWSLPIVRLAPAAILRNEMGFAGHVDWTRAHKVAGGHVDPGPNFPWAKFLQQVTEAHEQRFR